MKKIVMPIAFTLVFCSVAFAQPRHAQLIAVATLEKTENSQVADKAARAPHYLIFGKQGDLLEVISNPFCDTDRGAGPKAADFLASKNVTVVVAGYFGHKMKAALDRKGIDQHEASGIAIDVVKNLIK